MPVYGEAGPAGGYALLDSYRTNLTGLTEGEARALFMLSIPQPLADLGVGPELAAALRKLAAALLTARRGDETRVRQRFHLDAAAAVVYAAYSPGTPCTGRVRDAQRRYTARRVKQPQSIASTGAAQSGPSLPCSLARLDLDGFHPQFAFSVILTVRGRCNVVWPAVSFMVYFASICIR